MGIQNKSKLNWLMAAVPEGVALPSQWLTANSYSPQLVRKYVRAGWLVELGSRVYTRPGAEVTWEGVLLGLQQFANLSLHLGGVSALGRQGLAHYLPLAGDAAVEVYGPDRPPQWVGQLALDTKLTFHRRRLFDEESAVGWVELPTKARDWTLRASAPERAILEVLSEVDESESSFVYAAELFEGLTALRPAVVNALLRDCRHIKAKRLFLFLAHRYQYPWLKRVQEDVVELGRGKRQVTRAGRFDRHYQITVPAAFHAG